MIGHRLHNDATRSTPVRNSNVFHQDAVLCWLGHWENVISSLKATWKFTNYLYLSLISIEIHLNYIADFQLYSRNQINILLCPPLVLTPDWQRRMNPPPPHTSHNYPVARPSDTVWHPSARGAECRGLEFTWTDSISLVPVIQIGTGVWHEKSKFRCTKGLFCAATEVFIFLFIYIHFL